MRKQQITQEKENIEDILASPPELPKNRPPLLQRNQSLENTTENVNQLIPPELPKIGPTPRTLDQPSENGVENVDKPVKINNTEKDTVGESFKHSTHQRKLLVTFVSW